MSQDAITPEEKAHVESEIDRYLDRADAVIAKQRKLRTLDAPDCSQCRFHKHPNYSAAVCTHPIVQIEAANIAHPIYKKWIQECGEQRNTDSHYGTSLCGPHAALFQPIEEPVGLFAKIKYLISGRKS